MENKIPEKGMRYREKRKFVGKIMLLTNPFLAMKNRWTNFTHGETKGMVYCAECEYTYFPWVDKTLFKRIKTILVWDMVDERKKFAESLCKNLISFDHEDYWEECQKLLKKFKEKYPDKQNSCIWSKTYAYEDYDDGD